MGGHRDDIDRFPPERIEARVEDSLDGIAPLVGPRVEQKSDVLLGRLAHHLEHAGGVRPDGVLDDDQDRLLRPFDGARERRRRLERPASTSLAIEHAPALLGPPTGDLLADGALARAGRADDGDVRRLEPAEHRFPEGCAVTLVAVDRVPGGHLGEPDPGPPARLGCHRLAPLEKLAVEPHEPLGSEGRGEAEPRERREPPVRTVRAQLPSRHLAALSVLVTPVTGPREAVRAVDREHPRDAVVPVGDQERRRCTVLATDDEPVRGWINAVRLEAVRVGQLVGQLRELLAQSLQHRRRGEQLDVKVSLDDLGVPEPDVAGVDEARKHYTTVSGRRETVGERRKRAVRTVDGVDVPAVEQLERQVTRRRERVDDRSRLDERLGVGEEPAVPLRGEPAQLGRQVPFVASLDQPRRLELVDRPVDRRA